MSKRKKSLILSDQNIYDGSLIKNRDIFSFYFEQLKEIAINEFEWINLPDTISERFMELMLFEKGYAIFFKDKTNDKFLCLGGTIEGRLNVYNEPTKCRAIASNGYQQELTIDDSVIIFNNRLWKPTSFKVVQLAKRLANTQLTIDINIHAQRTPILIVGDENSILSLKNLYLQYSGGSPVIYGKKGLNLEDFSVLKTQAPFIVKDLNYYKKEVENEALTYLGIDNANVNKRERLIESEVNSNNNMIEMMRYTMLNCRKEACKKINKMFGLDIDVRFRDGYNMINYLTDPKLITDSSLTNEERKYLEKVVDKHGEVHNETM